MDQPGLCLFCPGHAFSADVLIIRQSLRYKDYHLVKRPTPFERAIPLPKEIQSGFDEVESVSAFAEQMKGRDLLQWWRAAMGYNDKD